MLQPQQDEILVDGPRLTRALHRQGRRWVWLGPLIAGLLLLLALALVGRSYTATVSVAVQQSSGGSPALALLTGGGGGASTRPIGILKSRELAEKVERRVHLRQLYGSKQFPTEASVAQYLMKNIKPNDDPTDSLLYISVSLPGPSRLASLRSVPTQSQIEDAAAQTANAYALALKEYYATTDTDQGAVLLRGADKQVKEARADYNRALGRLLGFSRGLSRVDPRSAPNSTSEGEGGGGAAAAGLGALYTAQAQVQAELRAAEASRATGQALVGQQLRDLPTIPTDDPLLSDARSRVSQDQTAYETASRLYGPENPRVVTAQTQLQVDQAELERQILGVKRNLTTPNVRSTQQIQSLYARQAVITKQVAQAEQRLGVHRALAGQFGVLQTEVSIQLDVLRATLTEAAKVRLDNASALSRMTVIDTALPPKSGEPGAAKLAIGPVLAALLLFLLAVLRDYRRAGKAAAPGTDLPAESLPGAGTNGTGSGHGPTDEAGLLSEKHPSQESTRL